MEAIQTHHPRLWQAIAGALLLLIFWLDTVSAPRGLVIPVLYVIPTILFVGGSTFAEPLIIAAIATVLTAAGPIPIAGEAAQLTDAMNRGDCRPGHLDVRRTGRRLRPSGRSLDRRITAANEALARSTQRSQDIEHALDQSAIVAATDQKGTSPTSTTSSARSPSTRARSCSGRIIASSTRAITRRSTSASLWRTIAHGEVWRGELRNRAKDGSIYWVDTTIVPFLNPQGKPWQYLAIRSDITARKAAEEKLRDEAALTQLGRLSAVVAHEVRNPLAATEGVVAGAGEPSAGEAVRPRDHSAAARAHRRARSHGARHPHLLEAGAAEAAALQHGVAASRHGRGRCAAGCAGLPPSRSPARTPSSISTPR